LTKVSWALFWVIFSLTHLVTLAVAERRINALARCFSGRRAHMSQQSFYVYVAKSVIVVTLGRALVRLKVQN
jgi:hypothetical protein